jgi:hypothetical protein
LEVVVVEMVARKDATKTEVVEQGHCLHQKRWSPQQVSAEKLEDRNYHLLD